MKRILLSVMMLITCAMGVWADGYHFQYEKGQDQHVIYLSLADMNNNVLSQDLMVDADYYVGAFINGECRGEAKVEFVAGDLTLTTPNWINVFTLNVQGDGNKDNNKSIVFRVYKEKMAVVGTAEYYIPKETASVFFQKDATTGEPSNTYRLKFNPATSIMLTPEISVHKGEQKNMLDYISAVPEGSLIPYPLHWTYPGEYVAIGDNILDALAVTTEGPAGVNLSAGTGELALAAFTSVTVDNPATAFQWTHKEVTVDANDPSKGSVTVAMGSDLSEILSFGYTLTPGDATTTYQWTSNNDAVVSNSPVAAGIKPVGVGTAVLTGTPQDESTATAPQLTVKVVNPVTALGYKYDDRCGVVVVEVGDNINQRLNGEITVFPEDATDLTYTISNYDTDYFEVQPNGDLVAMQANSDGQVNNVTPITVTANDGFGATIDMKIVIIPTQPTAVNPVGEMLYQNNPDQELDITQTLMNFLKLTPDNLNVGDFNVRIIPSDMSVVSVDYLPSSDDPVYTLIHQESEKQVTMNVYVTVLDKENIVASEEPGSVAPTVNIQTKDLDTSFTLDIRMGLGGFAIIPSPVIAKVGETIELTLVEQPQGVDFDPKKISLEVTPSVTMPAGWTFATVEAKTGDKTGLKWVINTKSVGNGTVNVIYEKEIGKQQMGTGDIVVQQQLQLNEGWQWISLYQGLIQGTDSMKTYFGDYLGEIRSDNGNIYNDPVYSYFGALQTLEMMKTYKVRMKTATSFNVEDTSTPSTYFVNNNTESLTGGPVEPITVAAAKGWNWIGNPYQYTHALSDIFGNTVFTEGDMIKGKESFATYTSGAWAGMENLTPGEGYMFRLASAGNIEFTREFAFKQPETQASARTFVDENMPFTIDHSRFIDNMSMIAYVGGLEDNARLTLYAFRGDECRGRSITVGNRQFITIHGEQGERYTFCAYDELSGQYYDVMGSRAFAAVSGSIANPVPLYIGQTTTVEAIKNKAALGGEVYDLQGRRVNGNVKKGIYIQRGKKMVK